MSKTEVAKLTPTQRITEECFANVIKFIRSKEGRMVEFVERLTKATGETQYRANVSGWLHPDPVLRCEPRFGVGMIIMRVYGEMRQEVLDRKMPPRHTLTVAQSERAMRKARGR